MNVLKQSSGTYVYCSQCKIEKNCCCDFEDGIDNVVTTVQEKQRIIDRVGMDAEQYFVPINETAFNIINQGAICPFYSNGCTIYDIRPSDCRLFPYDLKELNDKYYLIKYDLPCGSINVNDNVDEVVKSLLPIITTYTNKKIEEKVNKLKYKIVKEINI